MKRKCIQCGKEFELTNSEIGFYKKRKLALPKRCKECREQNKKEKGKGSQKEKQNNGQKYKTLSEAESVQAIKNNQPDQTVVSEMAGMQKGYRKTKISAALACAAAVVYFALTGAWPTADDVTQQKPQQSVEQTVPVEVYSFRTQQQLDDHYVKHGIEMGFESAEDYLEAANLVIASEEALHKIESEDGDDIYFIEDTNEFVVLSTDDYIRTYFEPEDGIEYFERQ